MQHHGAGLRRILTSRKVDNETQDALVATLATNPAAAALEPPDRAIVDYALKLTRTPQEIERRDVEALRQAGLNDRGIHDACAVTAYFGFVNRMADGLGVELEEG